MAVALQEGARRAVRRPGSIFRVELSIAEHSGSVEIVYKSRDKTVSSLPDLERGGTHNNEALFSLTLTPRDGLVSCIGCLVPCLVMPPPLHRIQSDPVYF